MNNGYLFIGDNVFDTLLAISEKEQATGLMYQRWQPPIMSFLYAKPRVSKFWMKNTPSPLDIVFTCNGQVTQIHKGEPFSTQTIGNDDESDLIVEFPFGTAKRCEMKVGDKVGLIRPTIAEIKHLLIKY